MNSWPDPIGAAQGIRASKVKALVGPEPHYRELLGAIALTSVRQTQAGELGILDSTRLMSATTAQEAVIPYPNEVGLMKRFTELTLGALRKVGGKFSNIYQGKEKK
ncbi:MAG: hypothetical protein IPJ71_18045 [Bdellovibrionales bacterium]|nr:hypothetical protein [Bdellovibrionales bacterium]